MKHRITSGTCFGANAKVLLNNKGKVDPVLAGDAIEQFFSYWDGFDFQITKNSVSLGIEPTYQYDKLKILTIAKNKDDSTYTLGKAWGPYGSQLVQRSSKYGDYKYKSKFIKFVDKWHPVLFPKE